MRCGRSLIYSNVILDSVVDRDYPRVTDGNFFHHSIYYTIKVSGIIVTTRLTLRRDRDNATMCLQMSTCVHYFCRKPHQVSTIVTQDDDLRSMCLFRWQLRFLFDMENTLKNKENKKKMTQNKLYTYPVYFTTLCKSKQQCIHINTNEKNIIIYRQVPKLNNSVSYSSVI